MGQYDGLGDEILIDRLRKGEGEILDYLMEKYKDLVRRKARALFLIGGDTDDLIQEGMIGLFKAVRNYCPDREASFQTFANLCVERQLYNAVNNSNRKKHLPLNSYVSLSREDEDLSMDYRRMETPEEILIDRENASSLEAEIREMLSQMENTILEYYLEGKSYAAIADRIGKPIKSVDNALKRIRKKISACLEKRCHRSGTLFR